MAVGSSGRDPMRCLLASASSDVPSDWLNGRGRGLAAKFEFCFFGKFWWPWRRLLTSRVLKGAGRASVSLKNILLPSFTAASDVGSGGEGGGLCGLEICGNFRSEFFWKMTFNSLCFKCSGSVGGSNW